MRVTRYWVVDSLLRALTDSTLYKTPTAVNSGNSKYIMIYSSKIIGSKKNVKRHMFGGHQLMQTLSKEEAERILKREVHLWHFMR